VAAYNKCQDFVEQLCTGVHNFTAAGHVIRAMLLTATDAPVATDTVRADWTSQPTGTGYTANGEDVQNTLAEAAGTATVTGTKIVWTAGAADWTAFRYVGLYNDTPAAPVDPLIAWWDYGSNLTLGNGETFTIKFNNGDPTGTIFTVA